MPSEPAARGARRAASVRSIADRPAASPEEAVDLGRRIALAVRNAVEVDARTLEACVVALMAEGHVLIEDVPGVGKTSLARALAGTIGGDFARVQGTADLLPADIVGINVYDEQEAGFVFRPGPIFADVVLVDELNRASPKTQSGLLEAMEEMSVSVDGRSHALDRPFLVLATQNPGELEGTFPLTEAQADRFMVRVSLGYPREEAEVRLLGVHSDGAQAHPVSAVASREEVRRAIGASGHVEASEPLRRYVVELLRRTREDERVDIGASPRAGVMLVRAAKARALLHGRGHVLPDDVQALADPVLAHRIRVAPLSGADAGSVVKDAIAATPAL